MRGKKKPGKKTTENDLRRSNQLNISNKYNIKICFCFSFLFFSIFLFVNRKKKEKKRRKKKSEIFMRVFGEVSQPVGRTSYTVRTDA